MKNLSKIKNYIYGKGIKSKLNSNSLSGIYGGKKFLIYLSNKKNKKGQYQLLCNINGEIHSPKDSNEIVRLINS